MGRVFFGEREHAFASLVSFFPFYFQLTTSASFHSLINQNIRESFVQFSSTETDVISACSVDLNETKGGKIKGLKHAFASLQCFELNKRKE